MYDTGLENIEKVAEQQRDLSFLVWEGLEINQLTIKRGT